MTRAILTCSEHFVPFAINEIRRYQPNIRLIHPLSKQHYLIQSPQSFAQLTSPWHHKPSIYLHHLFPVQFETVVDPNLERFTEAIQKQFTAYEQVQVRIVGDSPHRAYTLRQALQNETIKRGTVLSLLIIDDYCYAGMSPIRHNLSPYTIGRPYFKEGVPNRAGLKLLEAIETFDIHLQEGIQALDLGAAPGAWTIVLRRRGVNVTAIAPDEMYPKLQGNPHITHFHTTAESYLTQCHQTFDMIVNDMKMDAQDSARLMVAYADHLQENGIAVMTLKLRMRNTMRVMDHSYRILRKAYKIKYVRQLVSNKKEVTLILKKK